MSTIESYDAQHAACCPKQPVQPAQSNSKDAPNQFQMQSYPPYHPHEILFAGGDAG
jgi:hypothetical protein